MKIAYKVVSIVTILFALNIGLNAQTWADPASIDALITNVPITVDGNLSESAWYGNYDYLMFGPLEWTPGAHQFTVTGGALVKGTYSDRSFYYVKFLRNGLDLYMSIYGKDGSVCRFGDSWEGDGLFMKIKLPTGEDKEVKLYYNLAGVNPEVNFESQLPAGTVEAAAVKGSATIVNDTTALDNGYTMELVFHLAQLGFAANTQYVEVLMNIFDPDGYTGSEPAWGAVGAYYKSWWGSEWGPTMRKINLSATVLPVELTSLSAKSTTSGVDLSWTTATEINNRGFEIQRSSDNTNFNTIGFVKGNGTTTEKQSYSYFDEITAVGKYYYRLKQLDFDGGFEYTDAVAVEVYGPASFSLAQNYPNPFNPSTTLQFSLPENSNVVVKVYDMLGKEVTTAVNGDFVAGTHKINFNATNMASGNYIYQLNIVTASGKSMMTAKTMTLMK